MSGTQLVQDVVTYNVINKTHVHYSYPGIYCVSTETKKNNCLKVGCGWGSSGLAGRLDSYNCYCHYGWYLWWIILTDTDEHASALEKAVHTELQATPQMDLPQLKSRVRSVASRCEWYTLPGGWDDTNVAAVANRHAKQICGDRWMYICHLTVKNGYGPLYAKWHAKIKDWQAREERKKTRAEGDMVAAKKAKRENSQFYHGVQLGPVAKRRREYESAGLGP